MHTPSPAPVRSLVFEVRGTLPRTGGSVVLRSPVCAVDRPGIRASRLAVAELMRAANAFLLVEPTLLAGSDGKLLRRTKLIRTDEGYDVAEVEPGGDRGPVDGDGWLVRVVRDYGTRRGRKQLAQRAAA